MGSDQFSGGLVSCLYRLISRHYEVVRSLVSSTSQILLAIESESAASEELNELSDPGNAQKVFFWNITNVKYGNERKILVDI